MRIADFIVLLPLIIVACTIILCLLVIAFHRNHALVAGLSVIGLLLAWVAALLLHGRIPHAVTQLLLIDAYALFFTGLIIAATVAVIFLSFRYLEDRCVAREEYYLLLLLATLGAMVLVASTHFASFFLGFELLSVPLYALIAYLREKGDALEAGMKYLILAGVSSAFLLFGMALVYANTGSLSFTEITLRLLGSNLERTTALLGFGFIIVGVGFKLALVPFHFWSPDVYQGTPAPVTAFIATVSKGAIFAVLFRFFAPLHIEMYPQITMAFIIIAIISMFTGNLLALRQENLKRLLAYSSIAHLGYLLVAFISSGPLGAVAISYYFVAYFITIIGAFGVITVLSTRSRDADHMEDYRGLIWRHPWLGGVLTVMLFSLAGIPLTAGFMGKFLLLSAGVAGKLWLLLIILVINSGISAYYYLRIIVHLFRREEDVPAAIAARHPIVWVEGILLAVLTLLLFWFGIFPGVLLRAVEAVSFRLMH